MGCTFATLFVALAIAKPPAAPEEQPFLLPSARAGNSDLFLMFPIKGDAKNLTQTDRAEELYPAWSPDGKSIAFVCKTRDHDFEVYVCNADGTNRRRLTTGEVPSACLMPSWSADGQSIAYVRHLPNGKNKGDLCVVGVDGKDNRVLLSEASGPAWSPDGQQIAFVRREDGKPTTLCLVKPDGTARKVLYEGPSLDAPVFPAWSPDGKCLAVSIKSPYGWQIALVPVEGGSPRQLTHLPGFNLNPVWLDNEHLLFAHTAQPTASSGAYASIKRDGTRLTIHPLTKSEPPHAIGRPAFFVPRIKPKPPLESSQVKPAAYVEPGVSKKPVIHAAPVVVLPPVRPGAVLGAAWSQTGKQLALGLQSGLVLLAEFDGKTARPVEAFRGHNGPADAVAFTADGSGLISGGSDKTIRVWDTASKSAKLIETDPEAAVEALAVSHSGKVFASGGRDGKLRIRSTSTAKNERTIAVCDPKRGSVHALAFARDDSVLFAGCGKWSMPVLHGSVAAFDPSNGKELWRTRGTFGGVFTLALSPDGTKLAGACLDTFVRIWDARSGKELACWKGHADRVTGAAWAMNGKALVTCGFDHTVRVWDAATGTVVNTLAAHAGPVIRVAASPDGKHFVSTSQPGTSCVWKLDDGTD